jgi:uncharacterized cupin superfamily protein
MNRPVQSTIVAFDDPGPPPEASEPPAERLLSGAPRQLVWNRYSDPTGQFHAGIWQGEAGAWRVQYEVHEEELCTLLEGRVRLTDAAGRVREFAPGASFVVPGGFRGVWENLGRVRKVYAVTALRPVPDEPAGG